MKKSLLLTLILPFMHFYAFAQDCNSFYLFQNNKKEELAIFNTNGDANGTLVYNISNVSIKGNNRTAIIHADILDKKGNSISKEVANVKCSSGVVLMDMRLFLPHQQIQQFDIAKAKSSNSYLEYPAVIKNGAKLKDGTISLEIDNNGVKQALNMLIYNRTVTGTEQVNTQAGSWNCFTINYQVELAIQTGPIKIPLNFDVKEWYAPGFGIVKTTSEAGSSVLVALK